jgi:hypothetical protein
MGELGCSWCSVLQIKHSHASKSGIISVKSSQPWIVGTDSVELLPEPGSLLCAQQVADALEIMLVLGTMSVPRLVQQQNLRL